MLLPQIFLTNLRVYDIVSSRQILSKQFYLEAQLDHESVADYSVRIENLLRSATVSNTLVDSVKHGMLCSKLWNGLRDPSLKNSFFYKLKQLKKLTFSSEIYGLKNKTF